MNNDYELLEASTKETEIKSYLRHKKTGLKIEYQQSNNNEKGFSFTFNTPVEDQYLGTSHVLEHTVLCGSQKYNVDFWDLLSFSFYTFSNACTDIYNTKYFFNSLEEKEVFKFIPILADYVFFPRLSEEAFMQECFRVELDPKGDGRKKEIVSVIYNEMKPNHPDGTIAGGCYYKLHELTNEKIKQYHKKYYRPDNCLFTYKGNAPLEEVLLQLNTFLPELEGKFEGSKVLPQTEFKEEEIPPKKTVQKIISDFFEGQDLQEYKIKLKKLKEWQARNTSETAYKILSPDKINKGDVDLKISEEELWKNFNRHESSIRSRDKRFPEVYTTINNDSCSITLRASQLLSRSYYAEYALMFFLQDYISSNLRKLGRIYTGNFSYKFPADFVITTYATDKPEKTIQSIKEYISRLENYNFTETDILAIKYRIVSFVCSSPTPKFYFTDEIFTIKAEELHQAAIRLSNIIKPQKFKKRSKDETYYFTLSDLSLY